ncbi:MAG: putative ABC transporter permease [Lachnospiraceae bacterium]|nr:putative ABC transporter permease [Lachnospiraceae bacterium]
MEALWNAKFMGITFFNVYYTFFIFAIGGWVYESIFQSILEKKVLNRGFLNGPIIPIYGLGGMAVYILLFNDYTKSFTTEHTFLNGVAIYFAGLIFCTILEYFTSILMEKIFHARWWDYTTWPCNFQGRICLIASVFWGVVAVLAAWILLPGVQKLINNFGRPAFEYVAYVLWAIFCTDLIMTIIATVSFDKLLNSIQTVRRSFFESATMQKFSEAKDEIVAKYEESRFADYSESIHKYLSSAKGKINESMGNVIGIIGAGTDAVKDKAHNGVEHIKNGVISYNEFAAEHHIPRIPNIRKLEIKRIIRAFPQMKVEGREGALKDLKEKISLDEAEKKRHADIRKSSDSKANNCKTNSNEKSKDSNIENIRGEAESGNVSEGNKGKIAEGGNVSEENKGKIAEGRDNSEGKNNNSNNKSSGKKKAVGKKS